MIGIINDLIPCVAEMLAVFRNAVFVKVQIKFQQFLKIFLNSLSYHVTSLTMTS